MASTARRAVPGVPSGRARMPETRSRSPGWSSTRKRHPSRRAPRLPGPERRAGLKEVLAGRPCLEHSTDPWMFRSFPGCPDTKASLSLIWSFREDGQEPADRTPEEAPRSSYAASGHLADLTCTGGGVDLGETRKVERQPGHRPTALSVMCHALPGMFLEVRGKWCAGRLRARSLFINGVSARSAANWLDGCAPGRAPRGHEGDGVARAGSTGTAPAFASAGPAVQSGGVPGDMRLGGAGPGRRCVTASP